MSGSTFKLLHVILRECVFLSFCLSGPRLTRGRQSVGEAKKTRPFGLACRALTLVDGSHAIVKAGRKAEGGDVEAAKAEGTGKAEGSTPVDTYTVEYLWKHVSNCSCR